jgi:hypothetical protein
VTTPLPTIIDPRPAALGGLLTAHDLPKAGERKRWTRLYKAIIAEAIKNSLMGPQEACDRYYMTAAELKRWIELLDTQGIRGLSASNFHLASYEAETLDAVPSIQDGPLSIDFDRQIVRLDDRILHFTANQFRFLSLLIRRAPSSVSREDAYALLYGDKPGPQSRILDVMICKIRTTLGCNAIETVWGRGWRWQGPSSASH